MAPDVDVASSEQLPLGQSLVVQSQGLEILLVRSPAGLFAIENSCPHMDRSLHQAQVQDREMTCRYHGVSFDLVTGALTNDMGHLGLEPVKTFAVTERQGRIFVSLD